MLFDNWRAAAPFILFGCLALVVLLWGLAVRAQVVPAEESPTA